MVVLIVGTLLMPIAPKTRAKRGASELPPPPTKFQSYQFDNRLSGRPPQVRLSGNFFNSVRQDHSLKYSLQKSLADLSKILR